ncbi:MAG: 30S ribosomal protein S16 [Patescibacteria group bacterium]
MLTIRLQRVGRTNDPSFRLVLIESKRAPRSGAFKEILGSYDPRHKTNTKLKADRIKYWISKGATTSTTVHNLLIGAKIVEGKTKAMVPPPKAKVEKQITATA